MSLLRSGPDQVRWHDHKNSFNSLPCVLPPATRGPLPAAIFPLSSVSLPLSLLCVLFYFASSRHIPVSPAVGSIRRRPICDLKFPFVRHQLFSPSLLHQQIPPTSPPVSILLFSSLSIPPIFDLQPYFHRYFLFSSLLSLLFSDTRHPPRPQSHPVSARFSREKISSPACPLQVSSVT